MNRRLLMALVVIMISIVIYQFLEKRCVHNTTAPNVTGEVTHDASPKHRGADAPVSSDGAKGPGWLGEELHAGFKIARTGARSDLYDYDRGLVGRPKPYPLSREIAEAETHGADFTLSFLVKDQYGNPVKGASVVIGAFQRHGGDVFSGKTDDSGIATIKGFGTGELRVSFTADFHYGLSFRHEFFNPYFQCAEKGHWLPWNPLLPVTITRIGLPEVSTANDISFRIPKGECEIGVDLIQGTLDSLETYHGTPNCILRFNMVNSERSGDPDVLSLCIDFMEEECGGIVTKRDTFNSLPWTPVAPEDGYAKQLRFSWCRGDTPCRFPRMMEDDMILFRVRADDGHFRYGVIERPLSGTGEGTYLQLSVFVNANNPDSRNLEPIQNITIVHKHFRISGKSTPVPIDTHPVQ